ncbi:MAG: NEW3 domain-containing protein [Anaerolineae bacterium]|nr:NEW3 domain-containing protein [Anaerolineae bacterium]
MSWRNRVLALSVIVLLLFSLSTPVLAQEGDQQQNSEPLTIFTQYPAQEAAVGESVTFNLTLRGGASPQVVRLDLQNLPEGWTATFRGGGKVVRAAYVNPESTTSVDLRIELPKDVKADTYRFTVIAKGERERAEIPIELIVKEKLPPSLEFEIELPTLRGTTDTTFRYSATLRNRGDEDLSVNLLAEAPPDFQVLFKLTGQEVTSIPVPANGSKRLDIEAKAFVPVPVGTYPIKVTAQGGEAQAELALIAEVVGKSELSLTTPDGRLSGEAYAGEETSLKLVLRNNGTAPARNVELSASQPAGWSVEFDPKEVAEVPAGQQVEVTAKLRPSEKAIAGDYMVTLRARPEGGASQSAEFRITVRTSTLWGIVGVGLIAVAVLVVGLAVMRFGRR